MEVERIQAIASLSASSDMIPSEFIRPENEQPGLTTSDGPAAEIPVIDLSDTDHDHLVRAVADAAVEWGMFQVVNHGIPADVIEELQRVGKEFFELPQEEKEKYAMVPGSFEGYGTKLQKEFGGKKAWTDFFFHNIQPPSQINYDMLPNNPPSYRISVLAREANENYAKHLQKVVDELFRCLSKGAGLEEGELKKAMAGDEMEMLLKINYYPPCPRPDLALGVVAHTDMSALTVLVPNEVQGLQVFHEEQWLNVQYIHSALIIHVGDQIEILTNGKYKTVLHRTTVNKHKTRMSWPVFCSPPGEMVVGPLPQFVADDNPSKFKTKKYKDYQYCKINKLPQ